MKKVAIYFGLAVLTVFYGCTDKVIEIFTANSPVYMSYEELRNSVTQEDAKELVNPGKLYFKDNYIFIVEKMRGIHIIDNNDPSNSVNLSFVNVTSLIKRLLAGLRIALEAAKK